MWLTLNDNKFKKVYTFMIEKNDKVAHVVSKNLYFRISIYRMSTL